MSAMRSRAVERYDVTVLPVDGVLHAVNDSGCFAGQHQTPDGETHAIYVVGQRIVDLGTLGGSSSCARALNNRGTVVGGALTVGDEHHHAFVYANGRMRDLNDLIAHDSCELIYALGINDRGQIVAIGHCGGTDRVVLLTQRGLRSPP
jgi:probable HAF family extracellular repeat protein